MSPFTPDSLPDLSGRVYVVTGGNTGLGYETVLQLAIHHARVYLCCRSEEKGNDAIRRIKECVPSADIHLAKMDLTDLRTVVDAAEKLKKQEPRIHGLVNNAGIMATPYKKTIDGYEAQIQTNYISQWLLTQHLLPSILAAAAVSPTGVVRIVNVSSAAIHNAPSYGINLADVNENSCTLIAPVRRYGASKLANLYHARELWRIYGTPEARASNPDLGSEGGEIWTASINPGPVDTNLLRRFDGNFVLLLVSIIMAALATIFPLKQTVEKGAYTQLFAIASDDFSRDMSGQYLENGTELGKMTTKAKDDELAKKLWEWTEAEMKRLNFV